MFCFTDVKCTDHLGHIIVESVVDVFVEWIITVLGLIIVLVNGTKNISCNFYSMLPYCLLTQYFWL